MKFSICIDAVLPSMPPADAIYVVREAGFRAFEFWGWQGKDLSAMQAAKDESAMELVAFCTSAFELTEPSRRAAYIEALRESIAVAGRLGCRSLITQVGQDLGGARSLRDEQHRSVADGLRDEQRKSVADGLRAAAPLVEAAGITLLFEPLNTKIDHAGYYLSSSDEARAIAEEVGSPNVRVLFDLYHQQITEGDIIRRSVAMLPLIGHFHAAGNPGRHELDDGELNYPGVFRALAAAGYSGCVGLEYSPSGDPRESLRRAAALCGI